jgi:phosphomannomutase
MEIDPKIFKDYDVRGNYPQEINYSVFEAIGKELTLYFKPKEIAIGRDNRESSFELFSGMANGFLSLGVDVLDLGLITTDMIYFYAGKHGADLNIMVTGSHAQGENGFKICRKGAIAISGLSGLYEIRDRLLKRKKFPLSKRKGEIRKKDILEEWINHVLLFIDINKIKPFKIVVDTGNGMGGLVMPLIEKKLPGEFINLFLELDSRFPNHFPNPLIEENLSDIRKKIRETKADFGIAFDADGDRVFFLDEKGRIVNATILTAMIASIILKKNPGETILYNAVCGRIVPETIQKFKGKGIRVRVGHSLIKEYMREYNAIFAGEHSGHFYFRDNFYADSGLITFVKTLEFISESKKSLSQIVDNFSKYFQSGEINFVVKDKQEIMKKIEEKYQDKASSIDWLDGISVWFPAWWFNVRPSNTEPLLRLNVEADNQKLLKEKTEEIKRLILRLGGKMK